jgi:hypothetical protein
MAGYALGGISSSGGNNDDDVNANHSGATYTYTDYSTGTSVQGHWFGKRTRF